MFNYLEFEDKIMNSPFRKMRIKIKEPSKLPNVLNISEMTSIFKSAYENKKVIKVESGYDYFESLRNIVVVELLFATGARVSEIANLTDSQIDVCSGDLTIRGKGDKERIIQICNKETIQILKKYRKLFIAKINTSGGYFLVNRLNKKLSDQSIRIIVKNISKKASIKTHVTPHALRHTVTTLLLEKDVDIKYIQSILGHSSIVTTQIYTHVNREKQKQILKMKHPRKEFSNQTF
jgi:integrase/recombinase XerD